MLDSAFPASWTVRRARDAYLAENGFTVESYTSRWTEASFLGIPFKIPNTLRHQWALRLHDLHHVATGFGTDIRGEAEISVWEARRGLWALGLYVAAIVVGGALTGVLIAPRRALASWRSAQAGERSLFAIGDTIEEYEALLDLTVGELRALLHVPQAGLVQRRALHSQAPRSDLAHSTD